MDRVHRKRYPEIWKDDVLKDCHWMLIRSHSVVKLTHSDSIVISASQISSDFSLAIQISDQYPLSTPSPTVVTKSKSCILKQNSVSPSPMWPTSEAAQGKLCQTRSMCTAWWVNSSRLKWPRIVGYSPSRVTSVSIATTYWWFAAHLTPTCLVVVFNLAIFVSPQ